MNEISHEDLANARKSIASTIHKNEKVLITLNTKEKSRTSQIKMVEKNLRLLRIMQELIELPMNSENTPLTVSQEELQEVCSELPSLIHQIEKVIIKFKAGTPQHTLAARRIQAYELVLSRIESLPLRISK